MIKYIKTDEPSDCAKAVTTQQLKLTSTMKRQGESSETADTAKNKRCQFHIITRAPGSGGNH